MLLVACLFDRNTYETRLAELTDCDGVDDEAQAARWFPDADQDGHGDAEDPGALACSAPPGTVATQDDCDDERHDTHPGAEESPYDGIDQDCDNHDLTDVDGDGADALAAGGEDCDDLDPDRAPGTPERWDDDGVDNDCDGDARDPVEWTPDADTSLVSGVEPGGELGRRVAAWPTGACLFTAAPYADDATGTVYGVPYGAGNLRADAGGFATGSSAGAYLSADLSVSEGGLLATSEVLHTGGIGVVYLIDGDALCSGARGGVEALATSRIAGEEAASWFGSTARWLPDLDGDGLEDLAVSAPGATGGGTARGAVYLWLGAAPEGPTDAGTADVIFTGTEDGSALESVTAVDDGGGSGLPAVVLSQSVVTAGAAGLFVVDPRTAASGPADRSAVATIVSWSTGRVFSAVNVGDTDFDDADDLVAGVWTFGIWNSHTLVGVWDEADAAASLTYSTEGEWLTGAAPAGDTDGDGHDDILALAEDWPGSTERGRLGLISGAEEVGGKLDLASAHRSALGAATGDSFAYRVTPAGDFDEDGTPDLAVAAPGSGIGVAGGGAVYLVPLP